MPEYNPYTAMDRQDISSPGARESLRNAIETLIQARIASKQQINGNMAIFYIDQAIDQIREAQGKYEYNIRTKGIRRKEDKGRIRLLA